MTNPLEANFNDYKKAESQALKILQEMKTASAKPLDIELALLVAIFELHRDRLPAEEIGGIIRKHLETLEPFYTGVVAPGFNPPGALYGSLSAPAADRARKPSG
ncbi:MAG: hypothetical protein ACLFU4_08830 [Opitutales bacterium]